jgi:hypothetical protein
MKRLAMPVARAMPAVEMYIPATVNTVMEALLAAFGS